MTSHPLPTSWVDPTALGDLKAGVETLEQSGVDGETGLALVWLTAAPVSQGQPGLAIGLRDVEHQGVPIGHWRVVVRIQGQPKEPDPAQRIVLHEDGRRVWDVAAALDDPNHPDPLLRAQNVAFALLIGQNVGTGGGAWAWKTPLGRYITVVVDREA